MIFSGPRSCLCSKPEECEITGDNELEVVNGLTEVTIFVKRTSRGTARRCAVTQSLGLPALAL